MAHSYNQRVVVSGRQVEVYKYKKAVWRDFKNRENDKEPKQLNIFEEERKRKLRAQSSINRTRTELRRLINSNPELTKFLTLTFAQNITDLKRTNYLFNQFIKRLGYKYSDLKYVAVFEFQKRGAVHYHLLCNLPYVDSKIISSIWTHGFIKIKRTHNIDNIGAYMSKYLGKEIDKRTFGKKKFFGSQSLKKPIELIGYRAERFIEEYLAAITPAYTKEFFSEWAGLINYSSYMLPCPSIESTKNKC